MYLLIKYFTILLLFVPLSASAQFGIGVIVPTSTFGEKYSDMINVSYVFSNDNAIDRKFTSEASIGLTIGNNYFLNEIANNDNVNFPDIDFQSEYYGLPVERLIAGFELKYNVDFRLHKEPDDDGAFFLGLSPMLAYYIESVEIKEEYLQLLFDEESRFLVAIGPSLNFIINVPIFENVKVRTTYHFYTNNYQALNVSIAFKY